MSKRGRIPKQANLKTGHRDNSLQVLKGGSEFTKPKARAQWLTATRRYWKKYWDSELSSTAQAVDLPAFYRLFQFYDQVERANRMILKLGNKGLLSVESVPKMDDHIYQGLGCQKDSFLILSQVCGILHF